MTHPTLCSICNEPTHPVDLHYPEPTCRECCADCNGLREQLRIAEAAVEMYRARAMKAEAALSSHYPAGA